MAKEVLGVGVIGGSGSGREKFFVVFLITYNISKVSTGKVVGELYLGDRS